MTRKNKNNFHKKKNHNKVGTNFINAKKDNKSPNTFLENSGVVKAIRSGSRSNNGFNKFNRNSNNAFNGSQNKKISKNGSQNNSNNFNRNNQNRNNNYKPNNNLNNSYNHFQQNNRNEDILKNVNLDNYSDIITEIINEFNKRNLDRLHRIDEQLLEEAIVKNNKDLIELTIITYSFRKLMSKKHILYNPKWSSFSSTVTNDLVYASSCFREQKIDEYRKAIKKVQDNIQNTDRTLGHFIHNLVDDARSKLASTAYAYGMSLSQASALLSAQKETVMEMIGTTKISDEDQKIKSIKERVGYLKEVVK